MRISFRFAAPVAAFAALGIPGPAVAQDASAASPEQNPSQEAIQTDDLWTVSVNAGVTSDHVFRGVSQTEEDPALQAGVDVTRGGFYAGAWASNVSFPGDPDTNAEIDIYGGIKPEAWG